MTALSDNRNTQILAGDDFYEYDVAAGEILYEGALVVTSATGYAEAGTLATAKYMAGRAEEYVDNSGGSDGDKTVRVRKGVHLWDNSGTNTITRAHIGQTAYIEDDQTVGNLSTGMSAAGTIRQVDSIGVWVKSA